MRPLADGRITFQIRCHRLARNASLISTSETGVLRMPRYELSTMTGVLSSTTAKTLAAKPMP
jgi:hypothetical protein